MKRLVEHILNKARSKERGGVSEGDDEEANHSLEQLLQREGLVRALQEKKNCKEANLSEHAHSGAFSSSGDFKKENRKAFKRSIISLKLH